MIVIRIFDEGRTDETDIVLKSARTLPFTFWDTDVFVEGFLAGRARAGHFLGDLDYSPEERIIWRFGRKHGLRQEPKERHRYYNYDMWLIKAPKKLTAQWEADEAQWEREKTEYYDNLDDEIEHQWAAADGWPDEDGQRSGDRATQRGGKRFHASYESDYDYDDDFDL